MPEKNKYQTKQRKELLAYLKLTAGRHVTAADVCAHFKSTGKAMGTATVYRHLERMVEEGLVRRYVIDTNSPACFEFVGDPPQAGAAVCLHCKCEQCGRLIHLRCDELAEIQEHLASCHQFRVDPQRTVFYGVCEECQKQKHI